MMTLSPVLQALQQVDEEPKESQKLSGENAEACACFSTLFQPHVSGSLQACQQLDKEPKESQELDGENVEACACFSSLFRP